MSVRTIRRATLTALVFAALAGSAYAETTPPPAQGDQHHRMDRRGDRGDHMRMRMRAGFGGMMQMLGVVPMRIGSTIEFSEGRLAFLKAELKITEAQTKAWDAFAAALRDNTAKLNEAYKAPDREAVQKMGPAERIALLEKPLAARLDAVKRAQAAIGPLYAALSDDQKKTFDRFVPTGGMRADMRERMRERMQRRMERRGQQPGQPGQPAQPGQPQR
jgi:hypothetical protein